MFFSSIVLEVAIIQVKYCLCHQLASSFTCPSQVFYKDDLNWLRGIGCYAWDTPEILRVKQAGEIRSEVRPLIALSAISKSTPLFIFFTSEVTLTVSFLYFCSVQVQSQGYSRLAELHSGD